MKYERSIIGLAVFFSLLFPADILSQDTQNNPLQVVGFKMHRSFIIQHSSLLEDDLIRANPWLLEAEYGWHLRKSGTWSYCSCFPRAGVGLRYINFDLPDVLGYSLASYAFVEPFIRAERDLNFSIKFGIGPAYLSKTYDENNNPDNLFFSSPFSFIVLLNFGVNYRLNDRLSARLAADYNHISNGGYAEPNLGMNFPSLNIGIDYSLAKTSFPDLDRTEISRPDKEKGRVDLLYGLSFKPPSYDEREGLFPVHCLGINYSRTFGHIFALSGGMEWIHNRALKELVEIRDLKDGSGQLLDHNRLGVLAGIEWLFGRFIFSQHMGYYLYSPVDPGTDFYQRYGLLFRFTPSVTGGLSVKAHGQDANFIDIRMGVSL